MGMTNITIEKPGCSLAQLTNELFAAFPNWRRPSPLPGVVMTDVCISAEGDVLTLYIPAEDEADVRAVVAAHVAGEPPAPASTAADVIAALAAMNLEGVTTVAGLKAAIIPIRDAAAAVMAVEGSR